jgi:signal transduction histidine kinase
MLNPQTLRGRLSLAYASALIVALAAFAAIALFLVDGAQRSALDGGLESTANALRIVGDIRASHLVIDNGDSRQFAIIVGTKAQSAIVAPGGSVLIGTNVAVAKTLAASLAPDASSGLSDARIGTERIRVFASPIFSGPTRIATTLVWGDAGAIGALDRRVALGFAIAIPLFASLAILAGALIARCGLAPLQHIATLASEIEGHDLSRRLGLPARNDELGRLSATFDRMLDRLQNAFDRERRFTSDASHELRAPLSVIRAEADLALHSQRSPDEYRRALETIASEADALEELTRDLLAAARGGDALDAGKAPVDLAEVASAIAGRLAPVAGARRVRVVSSASEPALVAANQALVERAAVSALHNAFKYAPEHGNVVIAVSGGERHSGLTITDDGPGFSQEGLERAFDRFWRDDEPRAHEGSGLGLSIAKAIVERYGGTIDIANATPHGAVVRMIFPAFDVGDGT